VTDARDAGHATSTCRALGVDCRIVAALLVVVGSLAVVAGGVAATTRTAAYRRAMDRWDAVASDESASSRGAAGAAARDEAYRNPFDPSAAVAAGDEEMTTFGTHADGIVLPGWAAPPASAVNVAPADDVDVDDESATLTAHRACRS